MTRTWLVLLEFLEWPISALDCCWAPRLWLLLIGAIPDERSKMVVKGVSDVSLIPESVIMEETIDWGSTSTTWWSEEGNLGLKIDWNRENWFNEPNPINGVFFFVNEPQPDEPEAMEASSLELIVWRLATTLEFVDIRLVGAVFGPTDDMLLTRPKSSSDGNWLIFEEGLKREKLINDSDFETTQFTYTLNKISPLSMCILMVTKSMELSWRWRVS